MLKLICTTLVCIAMAGTARAEGLSLPTLNLWQPISVEKTDDIITVVLPQDQITDDIYSTVIRAGICPAIIITDKTLLDGVREVRVLNRHGARGFVAEGGKDLCVELNDEGLNDDKQITLLSVTHVY